MNNSENKIVFSTHSYQYLRNKVVRNDRFEVGEVKLNYFPDGERYQRIISEVRGRKVVIIGGTISDSDTLELYDLSFALAMNGASSLTVVIPYFGYSTMERAVLPGEVVTAKIRAHLFSTLPRTSLGNTFILMDLHTEGLPHYFEEAVLPIHLYCKPVIIKACRDLDLPDYILACTDAGRAKWVESLANDLGVKAAFVFKKRISGEHTEVTAVSADVGGKDVIIYDDMIRTGGSLINAAASYKEAGAGKIFAVTTHGIFSKNGLEKIKNSDLFEQVICTDTHPVTTELESHFLKIVSIGGLLADKLNNL